MTFESIGDTITRMQDDNSKAKNSGFVMIHNTFIKSNNYSAYEKLVFIFIKSCCNIKTHKCWYSLTTMAKNLRISRNTVIKTVKQLKYKRLIEVTKGEHACNTYKVMTGPWGIPTKRTR